jgi:hypothetical protein
VFHPTENRYIDELTLPIPQVADYIHPGKVNHIDPWYLKDESVDLVIVRGSLASQIGLTSWRAVAEQIYRCLKWNGGIVVDYLDRFKIEAQKDLLLNVEYYTSYLMERLMCKIGFRQDVSQSFGGKQVFYRGFKVKS